MKMLAKMEDLAPVHASSPFSFEFREPFATFNPLLVMEDGFAGYTLDDSGKKAIVCNIKLSLTQDLRIGLLGINGADDPTNHLDLQIREVSTVALAQFEGTLVLVSHDHHLLRATTDEFMIAVEGALSPFDGDLDDYRDWLFKTRLGKMEAKHAKGDTLAPHSEAKAPEAPPKAAAPGKAAAAAPPLTGAARQEQKRADAQERQRRADLAKPLATRIKRLEEQIAKLTARETEIDKQLAGTAIYEEAQKEALKALMLDQA